MEFFDTRDPGLVDARFLRCTLAVPKPGKDDFPDPVEGSILLPDGFLDLALQASVKFPEIRTRLPRLEVQGSRQGFPERLGELPVIDQGRYRSALIKGFRVKGLQRTRGRYLPSD